MHSVEKYVLFFRDTHLSIWEMSNPRMISASPGNEEGKQTTDWWPHSQGLGQRRHDLEVSQALSCLDTGLTSLPASQFKKSTQAQPCLMGTVISLGARNP